MLILDDKFSPYDTLATPDELMGLCAIADKQPMTGVTRWKDRLADISHALVRHVEHKVYEKGLSKPLVSQIPFGLKPNVARVCYPKDRSNNPRRGIIIPDQRINLTGTGSYAWHCYLINSETGGYENIGPKSGAVLRNRPDFSKNKSYNKVCNEVNLRVDEETGQLSQIDKRVQFDIPRVYEDHEVIFTIRLRYDPFVEDGRLTWDTDNWQMSVAPLGAKAVVPLKPASHWKRLGIVGVDFTKSFPLEPDELVIALLEYQRLSSL